MKKPKEIDRDNLPFKETEGDWETYLTGIMAKSWGLTPEELAEFDALQTEEERVKFMELHSKAD